MIEQPPEIRALLEKLSERPNWPSNYSDILSFLRDVPRFFSRCYSYRPQMANLLKKYRGDYVTTVHRIKNTSRAIAIDLSYYKNKNCLLERKTYTLAVSEFSLIATAGMPVNYETLKNGRWLGRKELFFGIYDRYALPKIIRSFLDYWHKRNPEKQQRDEIFQRLELIESLMNDQLRNPRINFIE